LEPVPTRLAKRLNASPKRFAVETTAPVLDPGDYEPVSVLEA
jgi:hypothetical protein